MYRLSIPVQNRSVTEQSRDRYLEMLKTAEADRIFLICGDPQKLPELKENVAFFQRHGFDVGVWIGSTVGHGGALAVADPEKDTVFPYQPLVNLAGQQIPDTRCPLDERFIRDTADRLALLADSGASVLLLDDDFRLSQHGSEFCCACPLHLAKMSEYCKEEVTLPMLRETAFRGKKNKYRDAWISAEGESMKEFAGAIRRRVNEVHPEVKLAFCTAHSPWDIDGTDIFGITRILSGNHPPLLRLHGAPYWACLNHRTLPEVIEIARMFAAFSKDEGFELMAEGDVYPRPRYNTPAAYLELFDAAMRADGNHDGILKYMVDYSAGPDMETGYIDRHVRDLPLLRGVEGFFSGGANLGARVLIAPHQLNEADLDLSLPSMKSPYPDAGILLSHHGIPTVYCGEGFCTAAFGEYAKALTEEERKRGVVLDAVGAAVLTQNGIDVGLRAVRGFTETSYAFLSTDHPTEIAPILHSSCRVLQAELAPSARSVLFGHRGEQNTPLCYAYENARHERFLVYLYDAGSLEKSSGLTVSTVQGAMLSREIPRLTGRPLPVSCGQHPSLSILMREEEGARSLLFLNCFADAILTPTVLLDRAYTHAEAIGCDVCLDGTRLVFQSDIPAFGFAVVRLT